MSVYSEMLAILRKVRDYGYLKDNILWHQVDAVVKKAGRAEIPEATKDHGHAKSKSDSIALYTLRHLENMLSFPVAKSIHPRGWSVKSDADTVECAVECIKAALVSDDHPVPLAHLSYDVLFRAIRAATRIQALEAIAVSVADFRKSVEESGLDSASYLRRDALEMVQDLRGRQSPDRNIRLLMLDAAMMIEHLGKAQSVAVNAQMVIQALALSPSEMYQRAGAVGHAERVAGARAMLAHLGITDVSSPKT